jgi:hypothetical protein
MANERRNRNRISDSCSGPSNSVESDLARSVLNKRALSAPGAPRSALIGGIRAPCDIALQNQVLPDNDHVPGNAARMRYRHGNHGMPGRVFFDKAQLWR